MTELLGKSVGEWTSNPYVNMFGMYGGGTNPINTMRNKACSKFIVSPQLCNIKLSEWSSRSSANASLKDYGLSQSEIEQAWTEFKEQVQEEFDRAKFINFAKAKVQSQSDNQSNDSNGGREGNTRGGRGRSNTDSNIPSREGNQGGSNKRVDATSNRTLSANKTNSNLMQYALIGGVVLALVGVGYLIFKKK